MSHSLILWILSALLALCSIRVLSRELNVWANSVGVVAERRNLRKIAAALREIEESLGAGVIPSSEKWNALATLPEPWGALTHQSLIELRESGAALLPTLRRLRVLALDHEAALMDAKARSAQALSQALLCAILVPVFGALLYVLLPGVSDHPVQWSIGCVLAMAMASVGSAFMLQLSNNARWAGLPDVCRPWILAAQCGGERLLAQIKAGTPADLSWTKVHELLQDLAPQLAMSWGASVWTDPAKQPLPRASAAVALIDFGSALRRSVQASVMEGRPCSDRIETALQGLKQELRSQVDRELSVLPTRALKPLFIFVAPSILGLLFFGMYLAWMEVSSGAGGSGFAF